MRFKDVKYRISQIKKTLLLNEELQNVSSAYLEGGTIIIDSDLDRLTDCYLDGCKIESSVPLKVDFCNIEAMNTISQTERIESDAPYARLYGCFFKLCWMPKGDYGNNHFIGNIQSSPTSTRDKC